MTELSKREQEKIVLQYLKELAENDWTNPMNEKDLNPGEARNKQFSILFRAFFDGVYKPYIINKNSKLGIKTRKEDLELTKINLMKNDLTKKKLKFWEAYRDLRNLITHTGISKSDFCYISEDSLEEFKKEVSPYINKMTAKEICNKDLYSIKNDYILADVLKYMKNKKFSNAPVVNNKQEVIGMFNYYTLFLYINTELEDTKNDSMMLLEPKNIRIEQLKQMYSDKDSEIVYDFVPERMNIYKLNKKFEDYKNKGKNLEALFVTKNGLKEEEIIGIITPWDMLKYFYN